MWQIGVWERADELSGWVARLVGAPYALVRSGSHPAQLAGRRFDLLVVSPLASGWAGAPALRCVTALLPGSLSALTRQLPAQQAVSYGTGRSNTITLSSLKEGRAMVAVQREFSALGGVLVERQELPVPYRGEPPELLLALAGARLLLRGTAKNNLAAH